MRYLLATSFAVLTISFSARAGVPQFHDEDLIMGHTAAGQLAVSFDFGEDVVLPPSEGLLNGWAIDDPGFEPLDEDRPANDLFTLPLETDLTVQVVAVDPALKAWTPGFGSLLDGPGDLWHLGMGSGAHQHPTWQIDSSDPAFDPMDAPWHFSFRLLDTGSTHYGDSTVYTMSFVPEPSSLALLSLGLATLRRRRGM